MSIIICAETWNNKFKKSSLEAISYGSEMAKKMNLQTIAIVVGKCEDLNTLGKSGANKVLTVSDNEYSFPNDFPVNLCPVFNSKIVLIYINK